MALYLALLAVLAHIAAAQALIVEAVRPAAHRVVALGVVAPAQVPAPAIAVEAVVQVAAAIAAQVAVAAAIVALQVALQEVADVVAKLTILSLTHFI